MTMWTSSTGTLRVGAHEIAVLNASLVDDECGDVHDAPIGRTVGSRSGVAVEFEISPGFAELIAAAARRAAALRTFRRAMRRHEKRARRMGAHVAAVKLRAIRVDDRSRDHLTIVGQAASFRAAAQGSVGTERPALRDAWRQRAHLFARAADAVAKLRGAS